LVEITVKSYKSILSFYVFFLFIAATTFSPSAYSEKEEHWQSPQYIEQSFYEIALRNEYNSKQTRLRKWQKPLRIYIEHKVGDQALHLKLVKMHLAHLHDITQLPISYVKTKSEANITVFLTRSSQVDSIISKEISPNAVKLLRNSVCLANIRTNTNSEIIKAIVIIPIDRARMRGKLVSCIVEELTQILGLPNDSKTIYPTIFSDRNIYKLLTGLDYLLLKLLYSPEVKSGMTQSELKPIIQRKLIQWKKDGTIKNAQKNVIEGELYQLMGYL
jgi:hypothetical protein